MTFFWQNPNLTGNPRVKRWVTDILDNRKAVEKAIGVPLRGVLGCGHWGCVVDSKRPWVVKLTIDPNEAPVWLRINQLIEEESYGQGGVVRTKGVYEIKPGVMYGGRRKRVYAIVREEVAPAFTFFRGTYDLELTVATKKKLDINPGLRALFDYRSDGRSFITAGGEPVSSPKIDELITTCEALIKFKDLAYTWHARSTDRFPQHFPGAEAIKDRLERTTYRMRGPIGGAIGETLLMLVSNGVVLRDVHLFNIGWRTQSEIPGYGYEDKTLVIFDPGHTPTGRSLQIPVARVANPVDWDWFQEEKR